MIPKLSIFACLIAAAFLAGCAGPCVLLPGGALGGANAPLPDSWDFTDDVDTIQLETLPSEPYSVNLWVVRLDAALYVHAGASRSTWVENMERDPNVRLRVGDAIYALTASRVEGQDEFDRFAAAYAKKYGSRPRNENVDEAYLFRLLPR